MSVTDADDDAGDAEQSAGVIDGEGNLFGVINVIDALVILGVIAVVVAGVALVVGADSGDADNGVANGTLATEQEQRYVTVAFDLQRDAFVDRILTGERLTVNDDNATVTDAYVYPTVDPDDRRSGLVVRLAVDAAVTDSEFGEQISVGGERLRVGDELEFAADDRTLTGELMAIDEAGESLQTERVTTEITVENVDQRTADRVRVGQRETTRGETIALIESASTESSETNDDTQQDLVLEVELLTLETETGSQFRGSTLREGDGIALDLGDRIVRGTVTTL